MPCGYCREWGHNKRTCPSILIDQNGDSVPVCAHYGAISLRGKLPPLRTIWTYRNNNDAYSSYTNETIVQLSPEIDHVFEIQLLNTAFNMFQNDIEIRNVTRYEKSVALALANCVNNTNITTQSINASKKGPFTRAKNDLIKRDYEFESCPGVDSYIYTTGGRRRTALYTGISCQNWKNIKNEVIHSYDHIAESVQNEFSSESRAALFADHLHTVFMSLKLEDP